MWLIARWRLVVFIPPSPLSISCRKPIAGLFAGELERHHGITAPSAPGQMFEHILQYVAQAFHRVLPAALATRGAMGFKHWSALLCGPGREPSLFHPGNLSFHAHGPSCSIRIRLVN
jgi:hypothetical protein